MEELIKEHSFTMRRVWPKQRLDRMRAGGEAMGNRFDVRGLQVKGCILEGTHSKIHLDRGVCQI